MAPAGPESTADLASRLAEIEEELVDAGVAFDGLGGLEWNDEGVCREDGIFHDRADLVRGVDDQEIEPVGDVFPGQQLGEHGRVSFGVADLAAEVFQTGGTGDK